jgi:hypothetical protein
MVSRLRILKIKNRRLMLIYDSVFEVVNIVTPRHIAITTNEK